MKRTWQQQSFRPEIRPLWDPATQHHYLQVTDRAACAVLGGPLQVWKWAAQFALDCHKGRTVDPILATYKDLARLIQAVFADPAYLELTDTQVCIAAQLMAQAWLARGQPLLGLAGAQIQPGAVQPELTTQELLEDVVSSTLSPLALAHLYDLLGYGIGKPVIETAKRAYAKSCAVPGLAAGCYRKSHYPVRALPPHCLPGRSAGRVPRSLLPCRDFVLPGFPFVDGWRWACRKYMRASRRLELAIQTARKLDLADGAPTLTIGDANAASLPVVPYTRLVGFADEGDKMLARVTDVFFCAEGGSNDTATTATTTSTAPTTRQQESCDLFATPRSLIDGHEDYVAAHFGGLLDTRGHADERATRFKHVLSSLASGMPSLDRRNSSLVVAGETRRSNHDVDTVEWTATWANLAKASESAVRFETALDLLLVKLVKQHVVPAQQAVLVALRDSLVATYVAASDGTSREVASPRTRTATAPQLSFADEDDDDDDEDEDREDDEEDEDEYDGEDGSDGSDEYDGGLVGDVGDVVGVGEEDDDVLMDAEDWQDSVTAATASGVWRLQQRFPLDLFVESTIAFAAAARDAYGAQQPAMPLTADGVPACWFATDASLEDIYDFACRQIVRSDLCEDLSGADAPAPVPYRPRSRPPLTSTRGSAGVLA